MKYLKNSKRSKKVFDEFVDIIFSLLSKNDILCIYMMILILNMFDVVNKKAEYLIKIYTRRILFRNYRQEFEENRIIF
jgi:hypothetical protein